MLCQLNLFRCKIWIKISQKAKYWNNTRSFNSITAGKNIINRLLNNDFNELMFFSFLYLGIISGVGVFLVTVSGVAWRMTAPGAPQCLGLGPGELGRCGRRPCSGRAPHGLLYPEFQHRPPPPSYQASMQEYRLRWVLQIYFNSYVPLNYCSSNAVRERRRKSSIVLLHRIRFRTDLLQMHHIYSFE